MTSENSEFGYSPEGTEDGKRRFSLTENEWCDVLDIVHYVATSGGAAMLYTSADGNALCLSIKHGKDGAKYWIGPDDHPSERINRVLREWGITIRSSPIDGVVKKTVAQEMAVHDAKNVK